MWLSILIFNTAESTAELINSAVMLYLAKPLRDNPCGDVGIEHSVHCLYPLTNENGELSCDINSFVPCEHFHSVGQAQLCTALLLMLESIISQLLGSLTDVCCTNKGFQLECGGQFICLVAIYRVVGLLISFKLVCNEAIIGTQDTHFHIS